MQVLVDADACPVVVKEMLYRPRSVSKFCVTLVANKYLRTPPSRFIKALQVPASTPPMTASSNWPAAATS